MTTKKILAFDLGAESGRGILGRFDGKRLALEVVHRFPNGPVRTLDTLHWDVCAVRRNAERLRKVRRSLGAASIGVDTWGVDFALLGRGGTLLGNPRHYRDPAHRRHHGRGFRPRATRGDFSPDRHPVHALQHAVPAPGPEARPLAAAGRRRDAAVHPRPVPLLASPASRSTSTPTPAPARCSTLHAGAGRTTWSKRSDLPTRLLGTLVPPGTVLGPLRSAVAAETGLAPVPGDRARRRTTRPRPWRRCRRTGIRGRTSARAPGR